MAEGGAAEKFPDEWDIQFLGNIVASQLVAGISVDFLIRRYTLLYYILFLWLNLTTGISNLLSNIHFLILFLSEFSFLTSSDKPFWRQNLVPLWNSLTPVVVLLQMVLILGPPTHIVPTLGGGRQSSFVCKVIFFLQILPKQLF